MTPSSKKRLALILCILILIGGVLFIFTWKQPKNASGANTKESISTETKTKEPLREEKPENAQPILTGPIRYNCELSSGTFEGGRCICPIEGDQTQEVMYDTSTGFCQSTHGGPAGDAFDASSGLPYGAYGFWRQIIFDLCEKSGGSISGVACICPSEKTYNKINGKCE